MKTSDHSHTAKEPEMLWYNNPESVLAIHQAKRETVATSRRKHLRLIEDAA